MLPKKLESPLLNPDITYKTKHLPSTVSGDDRDYRRKNGKHRFQNLGSDLSYEDIIIIEVAGKLKPMKVKTAISKYAKIVYETLTAEGSKYKVNRTIYKNHLMPSLEKQDPKYSMEVVTSINKRKAERNIRKKLKENPNYTTSNTLKYTIK